MSYLVIERPVVDHEKASATSIAPGNLELIGANESEFVMGKGSCSSCGCSGYRPSGDGSYCKCGHHHSQHR